MANGLVLYVDDEWTNQVVFKQAFGASFNVRVADSGEAALAILRSEPVSVLVTDQRMPGMTGNELLQRALESHPDTIRIVVTAYADLDPILRAVNEGLVSRYILKPWNRAELGGILRWAIEAHQAGRDRSELQARVMNAERLITLGTLTGAAFHDLRNILGHVRNNAEHIAHVYGEQLSAILGGKRGPITAADRERIRALVQDMPETFHDLLFGIERLEGVSAMVRRVLRPSPDDPALAEVVQTIQHVFSIFRSDAANIALVYEGPDELPPAAIGPSELTQILVNLVSNALQALPPPPAREGRVVVCAEEHAGQLRFEVRDNGAGMSPEVLSSAGTMFFSTRAEGAGLGLAQCKRLVEGHGGELKIDSNPRSGTKVSFTLPREV